MRTNFENRLKIKDSYIPYKGKIGSELNEKLAETLILHFEDYSDYLMRDTTWRVSGYKYYFKGEEFDEIMAWKMFLDNQYYGVDDHGTLDVIFGDNNGYSEDEFRDEYYFEEGMRIDCISYEESECEMLVMTYELYINYMALIRNQYEEDMKEKNVEEEEIKERLNIVDNLIENYCKKYNVEVAEDFLQYYKNLSDHILIILEPGYEYEGVEFPPNIEVRDTVTWNNKEHNRWNDKN